MSITETLLTAFWICHTEEVKTDQAFLTL